MTIEKPQARALSGVKVMDLTWIAAGPLTTLVLAQHGATVVKVESLARVDGSRTSPPHAKGDSGLSPLYSWNNLNKLSATINLKTAQGLEVVKRLVAWADIVAENFRPGTLEKWGLGYEQLCAINPSIILFRSSAQGQTGPHSAMGATGIGLQSLTGFTSLTGWPDRDPSPPWGAYTDLTVPSLGVAALLAALDYRDRTGIGQELDLSQFEASLHYLAPSVLDYTINGRAPVRTGNTDPAAVPHGAYPCRGDDRWCAITVFTDTQWQHLVEVMGGPAWASDSRFRTFHGRKQHEADLEAHLQSWTRSQDAQDLMWRLQRAGIPAGIVATAKDVLEDPQLASRGYYQQLEHTDMGMLQHIGAAFSLSHTPAVLERAGPSLGQDTDYVLTELLGVADDELIELLSSNALE